ncbi:MAG TPA: hypothetical protein H9720_06325 [Candidatus Limosilactobacillus intestinigallinarum]|nr:hypothetical protein [Candidatus Limosilactobacillus intestinigallinarum]
MKKIKLVCVGIIACGLLAGCGNRQQTTSQNNSSNSTSQQRTSADHRMATSSAKLSADNLTPQQNAALVMYYAGVKNNQDWVDQMNKADQRISITLYNPDYAARLGIKDQLPAGAQVLYSVKLTNSRAASYYTIVGNDIYFANQRGGFNQQPATVKEMVALANKNKAGDMINDLATGVRTTDQRNATAGSANAGNDKSATVTDPKKIGVMVLASGRGMAAAKAQTVEYMIMGKPNTYQVGLGTKDSTLNYTINGDQVTIRDGGYDYADSEAKTVSIQDLANRYYSNASDRAQVDNIADHMHTTDWSN